MISALIGAVARARHHTGCSGRSQSTSRCDWILRRMFRNATSMLRGCPYIFHTCSIPLTRPAYFAHDLPHAALSTSKALSTGLTTTTVRKASLFARSNSASAEALRSPKEDTFIDLSKNFNAAFAHKDLSKLKELLSPAVVYHADKVYSCHIVHAAHMLLTKKLRALSTRLQTRI